tara:strand:+ start:12979 stop:13893 length:915 start_codon:yes stop_codon:yes gene_type:complete
MTEMTKRILITTSSFGEFDRTPLELLEAAGYTFELNPYGRKLKKEEVLQLYPRACGVIAGTEQIDADAFACATELKVISRVGVGVDNVDQDVAAARGITVCNTPDGPTMAVAELTIGVILDLLRHIAEQDRDIRRGVWKKRMGRLLGAQKIGIVGMGRIGKAVARLIEPFGSTIVFYDPYVTDSTLQQMEFDELIQWADIVTVHMSGSECLFGEKQIAAMQNDAILVNLSRGGIVDEQALAVALERNEVGGAALDVFEEEPYSGPLAKHSGVLLTPHIGSYAKEARVKMEVDSVRHLLETLKDI